MSGRAPSNVLVVDANILIAAVLGRVGSSTLTRVGNSRTLLTTAEACREAGRVLADPRLHRPSPDPLAAEVFSYVLVRPAESFADLVQDAARCLRDAVASANGSTSDAHLLALAWAAGADVWSHDRDFGGTGWPSWSTRNLRAALGL